MACGPGEGLTPEPENLGRHQGKAWICREGSPWICGEVSHSAGSRCWNTRITDQIYKMLLFCALQNNTWELEKEEQAFLLEVETLKY